MEGSIQEARPSRRQADAPRGPAMSADQKAYFDGLYAEAMRAYAIAKQARRKGLDPSMEVEIPPAEDLAARVEAQVGPEGVAQRIRQATKEIGNRELVSLRVAEEVADDLVKQGEAREKCLDNAVRTGLSILTEGVLVAPLEGIAEVKIGANMDGTDYVDLWFAGPIRAAGGTGQAMSVLIADVVRRKLGIGKFVPTDAEVERYKEEIPAYKQAANLQYTPTGPEIELIARNCPICINGEGTEQVEVTGNRDLPRVEGNRLRGGACLVMAEGLVLKAPKVMKHVDKLGLEGWGFLGEFMKKAKKDDEGDEDPDAVPDIPPVEKFIKDIIAGRPVFSHPSRPGGFRLRYGRARTGGLAANAFSAATMTLVDDFLAVGTQLKVERPGKGTLATPCDELDGPTVVMKNGDLRRLRTVAEVKEYRPAVDEIVDLGEILIPFGEFAENNALLPDSSWVWEWWVQMHQQATGSDLDVGFEGTLTGAEMVELAETTGVPLHPDGTLLWHDIEPAEIRTLSEWVRDRGVWEATAEDDEAAVRDTGPQGDAGTAGGVQETRAQGGAGTASVDDLATGQLVINDTDPACKDLLVRLLCLHRVDGGRLRIDTRLSLPFLRCLGLDVDDGRIVETDRRRMLYDGCQPDFTTRFPSVELAGRLAGFALMPRAPCRIGGRMGRPEKADVRKMKPPNHGLFPIGNAGGNQRLVVDAAKKGRVEVNTAERHCTQCRAKEQWRLRCGRCDGRTEPAPRPKDVRDYDLPLMSIDLKAELRRALEALGMHRAPDVKGVVGVINKEKVPEPLEKAILRAKHKLWTFKDGTIRYDMTDVPITHFKPAEIHAPVERLHELGYTHDWQGEPLERDDQIVEMRVQDLIVSNGCMDYFLRTAQFLDELLERFYGLKPYHNATKREDMIGHFTIGLAPHTSGGVLSRIIGWTGAQVHYAHPYFHAAKRRNCMPGAAEVTILNSPSPARQTLAQIFDGGGAVEVVDDAGTEARTIDIDVLAADPTTGAIGRRKARRAYRVPAPRHLLRLRLKSGRSIDVSPHHRLEVFEDRLVKRKAVQVSPGDRLAFAGRVPVDDNDMADLDIWAALQAHPLPDTMVRGAQDWLAQAIDHHGLATLADAVGTTSKALDQYRRRDSIPATLTRRLERLAGPLPRDVRLAAKRDTVTLPRMARMDSAATMIGLYLAEGCARSNAVNQVDFAVCESPLTEALLESIEGTLGLHPTPQPTRVTLSGRLVHHLFTAIWSLGSAARQKGIPSWAAAAPSEWRATMLRALFDGDGSVERGRTHVSLHTVSRTLLRDVQTQLASFGVACRIRHEQRPGGGAVAQHAARTGRPAQTYACWSIHIRSQDAKAFHDRIGFGFPRKQEALGVALEGLRTSRLPRFGDLILDEVVSAEPITSDAEWLYDLEVDDHHNFLAEDLVLVSNCDGDEDALLLLMDGLLNFSRHYVPDRRGGLMDLPLVLTTRLDPNEIDKEAHNVDTLRRYPLSFYEATTRHANSKDVSQTMRMVEELIGTPEQYEGFGFTHDTADIAEGPAASAYKVLETTMEKLTGQMELARKIRAVDEPDVGAKVIGTHLLPDIMGNLKAFSKQKVRCPQCNAKYRRMPLKGVCLQCGNPKLTLTVHEGSVRKYLEISKEIADKYHIDAYTRQRIMLLEQAVESLFNNDKVRKSKLDEFF